MRTTRNLNPARKKQSKPLRRHFRSQFITRLNRLLDPRNPYPEQQPHGGGHPAPPPVLDYQPAEGTQNLSAPSPSAIRNITPSSSITPFQAPWPEALQPSFVNGQLFAPPTHQLITINTRFPVSELVEDHAQSLASGSLDSMYPEDLDGYGSQPYDSTQGNSGTNFETLDDFHYADPPPVEAWGAQYQDATDPYFTQEPNTSAQQTWEQQPDPLLDLTSIQCQSVRVWGPNESWTYLNAVFDETSQHSFFKSSAANKAGWNSFTPVAPGHNPQSSTQYGLVTPTQYVNAYIAADGFFGFPERNDDIYIFPDGQSCPANVEVIIGRNLWQTVYHQAEASTLAPDGFSY